MDKEGRVKNNFASIPKSITKGRDLVVLPREEYNRFLKWEKEVKDALDKVRRGRKAYKEGKTEVVSSPRELL